MARKSAEERREEIVEIAFRHFAEGGYNGTSTEAIAREAGISQPYLFRLFRTKRELFLACSTAASRSVTTCSREAAAGAPRGRAPARDGSGVRGAAAARPPRAAVPDAGLRDQRARDPRPRARRLQGAGAHGRRAGGLHDEETWDFFAYGMMLNVAAALDLTGGGLGVIFRHRRAIGARWCWCCSRRCSRCRCSASSATRTTSTIPRPRPSPPATPSPTHGRLRGAELVALVRLNAQADTRRPGADRACRRGAARSRRGAVVAYEPGGDRRLVSRDGRSTYLLPRSRTIRRGRRGGSSSGSITSRT